MKLTHETDYLMALTRIDILCRSGGESNTVLFQIKEIAQAAIENAKQADRTIDDIQNGHLAVTHT